MPKLKAKGKRDPKTGSYVIPMARSSKTGRYVTVKDQPRNGSIYVLSQSSRSKSL